MTRSIIIIYNRAYIVTNDQGDCVYSATEKSVGCAIGRHLDTDVARTLDSYHSPGELTISIDRILREPKISNKIPKWMSEMGVEFLSSVQLLHDNIDNWNNYGLSDKGNERYNHILHCYCGKNE